MLLPKQNMVFLIFAFDINYSLEYSDEENLEDSLEDQEYRRPSSRGSRNSEEKPVKKTPSSAKYRTTP